MSDDKENNMMVGNVVAKAANEDAASVDEKATELALLAQAGRSRNYSAFVANTDSLWELLHVADAADLSVLVDYITDKGEGRVALASDVRAQLVKCRDIQLFSSEDRSLIGREIRLFGGNSIANAYRSMRSSVTPGNWLDGILPGSSIDPEVVPYREVVADVAKHFKANFAKDAAIADIELAIMTKVLSDAIEKVPLAEREAAMKELGLSGTNLGGPGGAAATIALGRAGGFATYKLAQKIAQEIAKRLLGHGLKVTTVSRTVSVLLGPIAWAITAAWTAVDLASPAYRVTAPCVLHIAYMRRKAIMEATMCSCPACGATIERSAKYCPECGAPTSTEMAPAD